MSGDPVMITTTLNGHVLQWTLWEYKAHLAICTLKQEGCGDAERAEIMRGAFLEVDRLDFECIR